MIANENLCCPQEFTKTIGVSNTCDECILINLPTIGTSLNPVYLAPFYLVYGFSHDGIYADNIELIPDYVIDTTGETFVVPAKTFHKGVNLFRVVDSNGVEYIHPDTKSPCLRYDIVQRLLTNNCVPTCDCKEFPYTVVVNPVSLDLPVTAYKNPNVNISMGGAVTTWNPSCDSVRLGVVSCDFFDSLNVNIYPIKPPLFIDLTDPTSIKLTLTPAFCGKFRKVAGDSISFQFQVFFVRKDCGEFVITFSGNIYFI